MATRISRLFNRRLVWHVGEIGGFLSYIGRYPQDNVTIIILSNREDSFVRLASRDLAAIVFGECKNKQRHVAKRTPDSLRSLTADALR